ncbi:MAG: hypothetical protein ABIQ18_23400 [Umezawaea sp.]
MTATASLTAQPIEDTMPLLPPRRAMNLGVVALLLAAVAVSAVGSDNAPATTPHTTVTATGSTPRPDATR